MKKLVLTVILIFIAFSSICAQNEKQELSGFDLNNFVITGSLSFSSIKNGDNNKTNRFSFNPKAGYFLSDNVLIGITVGFSTEKGNQYIITNNGSNINYLENGDSKSTSISPGIFSRYYFSPKNKFSIFTELTLGYMWNETKIQSSGFIIFDPNFPNLIDSTLELREKGFFGKFSPGISYFISDSFALEASLGLISYSVIEPEQESSELKSNEIFNISLDLSNINLGLVYRFN